MRSGVYLKEQTTTDIANVHIVKNQTFPASQCLAVDLHHEISVHILFNAKFVLFQLNSIVHDQTHIAQQDTDSTWKCADYSSVCTSLLTLNGVPGNPLNK